jgi:hypothetical protein
MPLSKSKVWLFTLYASIHEEMDFTALPRVCLHLRILVWLLIHFAFVYVNIGNLKFKWHYWQGPCSILFFTNLLTAFFPMMHTSPKYCNWTLFVQQKYCLHLVCIRYNMTGWPSHVSAFTRQASSYIPMLGFCYLEVVSGELCGPAFLGLFTLVWHL